MNAALELLRFDRPDRLEAGLRGEFRVISYFPRDDDPVLAGPACAVRGCVVRDVPTDGVPVCAGHRKRFKSSGTEIGSFLADLSLHGPTPAASREFSFANLSGRLRAEMQFALQERSDLRRSRLYRSDFITGNRLLVELGVCSVLDLTPDEWTAAPTRRSVSAWLRFCWKTIYYIAQPIELEDRDFWLPRDFPFAPVSKSEPIRFDTIHHPWIRAAATHWAEWRLQTGKNWKTAQMNVEALRTFSEFLVDRHPSVAGMGQLRRQHLLDFVGWMNRSGAAASTVNDHTSGVRLFLEEYRTRDDWGPSLHTSAVLRYSDVAVAREALPRPVPEPVMNQIESPANLDRLPGWLLTALLIGIRCGLRASSVVQLGLDCVRIDSNGAASLIYTNTKRNRERVIPLIHDDALLAIRAQQQEVRLTHANASPWLFPARQANPDGKIHIPATKLTQSLAAWAEACDIRDPGTGEVSRFTFHQFRHTFGTRLLESGASEYLVSQMLDHTDSKTTRGYAQMSDQSKRREFEQFARVNNHGNFVPSATQPDEDWLKESLNRIQVTLPNGYCTLPLQQKCEMRNACLDCDTYFVTTRQFLDVHTDQLRETRRLIAVGDSNGNMRMVEKNEQLETRLVEIIQGIDSMDEATSDDATS